MVAPTERRARCAMAGGYGNKLEDTVQVQVNTFRVAVDYARRWHNRPR